MSITSEFQKLIPKDLDDIFRKNKHEVTLSQANQHDLRACKKRIPSTPIRHRLIDTRVIKLTVHTSPDTHVQYRLIGYVKETGQVWSTSAITCIKSSEHQNLVVTHNSVYEVEFSKDPLNSDMLIHLCIVFNNQGLGEHYDIPAFFY